MRGLFITFEGIDGSGKTTQIRLLYDYLVKEGYSVVLTREPGGTRIGDKIRGLLLDPENREMTDRTEVLLYAASRAQHVQEVILPAVASGKIVLCDRFVDASLAYQGYGHEKTLEDIVGINEYATGGVKPDRTYMLMLSLEESGSRLQTRFAGEEGPDRIEMKPVSYHSRVWHGFNEIANGSPHRIRQVDAGGSREEIQEEIRKDFMAYIKQTMKG
ncbi:MAG TPA: dTMP kinase [Paenibacillaceae bacterium]|nr:dTMP kinase [Paenibacillaceae bacterium]